MSEYIPFLVFGLVFGSIYGLAAMGLVLTYRTSGIFNFGHGAVGAGAAYVFFELRQEQGLPWPVAALISVFAFGIVLGLILERMARGLSTVPVSYQIVGTVGLLLLIRALATWIYGPDYRLFSPFITRGNGVHDLRGRGQLGIDHRLRRSKRGRRSVSTCWSSAPGWASRCGPSSTTRRCWTPPGSRRRGCAARRG